MSKMQYNAKYKNVGYKIMCVYFYLEKRYSIYLYYILMEKAMATLYKGNCYYFANA